MRRWSFLLLTIGVLLLAGVVTLAQGGYELTWWRVAGGGSTGSMGGGYTLSGTAGQSDAGVLAGGGYVLGGGFFQGGGTLPPEHAVYLPMVLSRFP
jgi:hypothetical protein